MIYTVTFNPALDYIVHTDNLSMGNINRIKKEQIFAGGKGINVSIVLGNLGFESVASGYDILKSCKSLNYCIGWQAEASSLVLPGMKSNVR